MKPVLQGARTVAVVGIGSELRGDDAAGLLVIRELRAAGRAARPARADGRARPRLRLFEGGTAPENLTGVIRRCRPSHVLLVDAAGLGRAPGEVRLVAPDEIIGLSLSTHALPLKLLCDYLARSHPCKIVLIGIQPGRTDFGAGVSGEIRQAARQVAQDLLGALEA